MDTIEAARTATASSEGDELHSGLAVPRKVSALVWIIPTVGFWVVFLKVLGVW